MLQALNNLLSALAEIEESDMSADDIRQLLQLPTKTKQAPSTAAPQRASPAQRQQQQQQQARPVSSSSSSTSRPLSPGGLQATARQLGQLSPELAEEWYDRALRQGLEQVECLGLLECWLMLTSCCFQLPALHVVTCRLL